MYIYLGEKLLVPLAFALFVRLEQLRRYREGRAKLHHYSTAEPVASEVIEAHGNDLHVHVELLHSAECDNRDSSLILLHNCNFNSELG